MFLGIIQKIKASQDDFIFNVIRKYGLSITVTPKTEKNVQ